MRQDYDSSIHLFPVIEPFDNGYFEQDIHKIYYEQVGNPEGKVILFLHGGPGAGCSSAHRRLFDPEKFRVIFFDQRGSGRSKPYASIEKNTTQHLISDINYLREKLKIEKWILFGGSWGSTLALAYAIENPVFVSALILRGVFLGTNAEINWYLYEMRRFFPEAYDRFISYIPVEEQNDILSAYHKRLTSDDQKIRNQAAKFFASYENSCATLHAETRDAGQSALSMAVLEAHYFMNDCFLPPDYIAKNVRYIQQLPCYIVQGRHDVICPPSNAYKLHKIWGKNSKLRLVDDAGHSAFEHGTLRNLMLFLQSV